MNVEQVCARLCPKPLGPLKDINILWNLWAVVFLYKAKRRVGSKVNKISDEEYFYFTFTLFLDFKFWQDLIVDTGNYNSVLKVFNMSKNCSAKYRISMLHACKS